MFRSDQRGEETHDDLNDWTLLAASVVMTYQRG